VTQWKITLLVCLIFSLTCANVFASSQKIDMSSSKEIIDVWNAPHEIQITTVRKIQSTSSDTSKQKDIFVLTIKIVTHDILLQSWLGSLLNKKRDLELSQLPRAYLVSTVQSPALDMQTLIYEYAISFFQTNPSTWLINVPMQNLCTRLKYSDVYPAYEVCIESSFISKNKDVNEIHCLNMSEKNVTFDKGTMAFTPYARRNGKGDAEKALIGNMPNVCDTLHKIDPNIYDTNFKRRMVIHPLKIMSAQ